MKQLTQAVFIGKPKKFKWAAVDLEGKARLFINKPTLTGPYNVGGADRWVAHHMAKKDTADFRRKYSRGVVVGEGFLCEIYTKSEHDCILRREASK